MTSVKTREQDDSGEYSDASQDIEQNNVGTDGQQESDYDSAGSDSEHSEREPKNDVVEHRSVDDDEDRSNPQYIPKRGTFYEHDDRTASRGEEIGNTTSETASEKKEVEAPPERRRAPRKSEIIDKWSHDKYNENEQVPKSREELVAIYGYDIRNEDAPPHARRNRRYGRGPNKYTRTWEDEDAYRRGTAQPPHRRAAPPAPPVASDFPDLETAHRRKPGRQQRPRSKSQPASNTSSENGSQLRRNASTKAPKGKPKQEPVKKIPPNKNAAKTPQAKEKMPQVENLTITATVYNNSQGQPQRKVNAAVAQQKPVPTEQGKKKLQPQAQQPQQQNNTAPKASPQPQSTPHQQQKQQNQNQQQQSQQQQQPQQPPPPPPPASGAEQRGSKRYSSLRQRPLAETYSPQPQPAHQNTQQNTQQHRYVADYQNASGQNAPSQHQGSPVPQIHPQQMMHQVHCTPPVSQTQHGPSPPHQALPQHSQQVRLGILEQQQLVSHPHHQLHNMPQPHAMGQLPPTQGYAPPAMMPAQYMQQGGNSAVYAGAMYAQPPPGPYPHQLYQHHNYATQAGGVTYYSPSEQEQAPRAPRRPTAAIPIVRPAHPHHDRTINPTEKDNIDRIVENMFVRKPRPAAHGADSKEKSESRNSQEPQNKDNSQPNSLTSSSISTDSKPSDNKEEKVEEQKEDEKKVDLKENSSEVEAAVPSESISADA